MRRVSCALAFVGALSLFASTGPLFDPSALAAADDPHAYFNALVARTDHWKSFSLRPLAGEPVTSPRYQKQLDAPKNGGFASSNSGALAVTYDPANDRDPFRQDAAKVVIPAFQDITTVSASITETQTSIPLTVASTSLWANGRTMKVDGELMVVSRVSGVTLTNNLVPVIRGQFGTAAVPHSAGAVASASTNSLANQLRLPLGTSDGNTYLVTWDAYWTSSYLASGLTNHKAFQFTTGGDAIWLEQQVRYDGGGGGACASWNPAIHVAGFQVRSYQNPNGHAQWSMTDGNQLGPSSTDKEPLEPKLGSFCISANRWTRFWVRFDQRANDYDYVDMWIADENQNPVQIYDRVAVSVRSSSAMPNTILKFWLEFNTSTSRHARGDTRDFVTYVRNFVSLINPPANVTPLLLRPAAGVPLPPVPTGPQAPRNLRILTSN